MKWSHVLALYLFWPALVFVVWGEMMPHPPHDIVYFWDKSLHFTAYFGLAGMAAVALKKRNEAFLAILGLILLGGVLEVLQGFTGRDPDIYDEIANTLGALTGAGLGRLLMWVLQPKTE